jgi:predicted AlkP superfamily phosphohydrolase/phosphomutase
MNADRFIRNARTVSGPVPGFLSSRRVQLGFQARHSIHRFTILAALLASCGESAAPPQKLIVLGIDGFDAQLAERWVADGRLPNLGKLMSEGRYMRLGTSNPPQSPVAWSDFITGHDSDEHGIYDFVHRDPADRSPYLSTSRTDPPRMFTVGSYEIPLGGGGVELLRKGKPFWEVLGERGIPSTVFQVPANYPPSEAEHNRSVSGMGTPDLLGTYGTFHAFTDDRALAKKSVAGGRLYFLDFEDGVRAQASLHGPPNPFSTSHAALEVPVEVVIDRQHRDALVRIGERSHMLKEGEWTEWIPVSFEAGTFAPAMPGMVRALLASVSPRVLVYVSPINIDPTDPALPITSDPEYLEAITGDVGRFHTQGMPEDTKALEAGILTEEQFLELDDFILTHQTRLLDWHLEHFQRGLLFFYFSTIDQTSHVFWRPMTEEATPEEARFAHVIPSLYERFDAIVGEVINEKEENTTVLIMSDHGFAPWTWQVNLNAWLVEQGYLVPYPKRAFVAGSWQHVDWVRTKAYAVGLNQIFLNLEGREGTGFVPAGEREKLRREIAQKLEALLDPSTGERVVTQVYLPETTSHPERTPDLIVGYARGYRSSNDSAIGDIHGPVLERNVKKWSGDHCMDPSHVPGVLLTTGTLTSSTGKLTDLAPTILGFFGVSPPDDLKGKRLLEREKAH